VEILGVTRSGEYIEMGSNPLVISGFARSGVVFPNFFLKSKIILSGI
jgi:hypothetical protein